MGIFERANRHSHLMGEMMRQTGVDLSSESGILLGRDLRAAVHACAGCNAEKQCESWLAEGHQNAEPPDFCRNADLFRKLGRRD
ncbi:DUF6455 family protein [Propylenella binzhouense]|uniref:DUF6455 domain-containing protein n=1 Tax=Propylenella binzhouense TaxID=2555902 RepID=A0A964T8Y2_9HYPH|nr:DUF6455 family protein [Propylenella binzhouense]MYZ50057.1 hypothetical protein [Propylenella binzhouense]